jgi:BsuBI/PstI restriction endonuclease domain/BsuBI/PstI restriction endonuclease HTH domain
MSSLRTLPALVGVGEVQRRLESIFPTAYPDRSMLIGQMAARAVFVFLYGGFLNSVQHHLRPIVICRFTAKQARRTDDEARRAWIASAFKQGFRPPGAPWYADNTRESLRDDLFRNRLVRMGLVTRKPGVPTNSSAPIYSLSDAFAALFEPALKGSTFDAAALQWREKHLAPEALARMVLKARGAMARSSDVIVEMPDRSRLRLAAGPSSLIVKALIEEFAPRWMVRPVVLWVSASDVKTQPHFVELAESVGFRFDAATLLPDLILADVGDPLRIVFCEVVATDGPIDDDRKAAFVKLSKASGIDRANLHFLSAYLDRESAPLRKTFHRVAVESDLWFTNEPDLLVRLVKHSAPQTPPPDSPTDRPPAPAGRPAP